MNVFLSVFDLNGYQHAVVYVLARGIRKHLNAVKDVLTRGLLGFRGSAAARLPRQELKEALCHRFIMTGASAAHTGAQRVLQEKRLPVGVREM